jgi:hypothetical protein
MAAEGWVGIAGRKSFDSALRHSRRKAGTGRRLTSPLLAGKRAGSRTAGGGDATVVRQLACAPARAFAGRVAVAMLVELSVTAGAAE